MGNKLIITIKSKKFQSFYLLEENNAKLRLIVCQKRKKEKNNKQ